MTDRRYTNPRTGEVIDDPEVTCLGRYLTALGSADAVLREAVAA